MKKLILVRGLPGSGKTTYATKLCDDLVVEGKQAKWLETTMYFETFHVSLTKSEQTRLADQWIKAQADKALDGDYTVVVSNVAPTKQIVDQWKAMAEKRGAEFEVVRLDTHWQDKCPPFVLDDMKKKFEDYPGETVIGPEQQ